MNRFLNRSNKVLVAIGILGLVILVSLLTLPLPGCAKQARKAEQPKKLVSPRTTKTPRPKTPTSDPAKVDLSVYLSPDEQVKAKLFADVNKDGKEEVIFLASKSWDVSVQDPWLATIRILEWNGSGYSSSWAYKTEGERSENLEAEDINNDSVVEILSYQTIGNSLRLYIVAWNGVSYDVLEPVGGNSYFRGFYGLNGAKVQDDDNDGVKEIYGYYGPAGSQADIYKWDGQNYVYQRTTVTNQ